MAIYGVFEKVKHASLVAAEKVFLESNHPSLQVNFLKALAYYINGDFLHQVTKNSVQCQQIRRAVSVDTSTLPPIEY